MPTEKLAYAISYANYGMAVFPCHHIERDGECSCGRLKCPSAGKHPRDKGWQAAASLDEQVIQQFWRAEPLANIGVACGEMSGITVLDVDGDLGRETLRDLELQHGELPETPIVITGRGGNHYYFQYEPSATNFIRFAPGLDIKTEGGLVVGVGSKTRRQYAWEAIAPLSYDLMPAKMPEWLVKLITTRPNNGNGAGRAQVPEEPLREGEGRNNLLFKLARSEHAQAFPAAAIEASVRALNKTFKPPLDDREVEEIIRNATKAPDREDFRPRINGASPKKKNRPGKSAEMFELEKVEWLWKGYIPLGKLSDLQGDPGQGKSVVTATLAAIVSRGMEFPTGEACEAGGVVMVSGEDNPNDTICPRLVAANAYMPNVYLITLNDDPISLPEDIDMLREIILERKAKLLILDPLDCFISDDIEANKNQSIRKLLAVLAKMAAETRCSVMVVRHLNKEARISNPMYRGGGSIGLNAASRQVLLVGPAPDDATLHVLAPVKENLGPISPSLGYRIIGVNLDERPDIETAKIAWLGLVQYSARQLLEEPDGHPRRSAVSADTVADRLREMLSDGSAYEATKMEAALKAELGDISQGTIWNARRKIGARAYKKGFPGTWWWSLSSEDSEPNL